MEMGWAGRCLEVACMCVDICICKHAMCKGACLFWALLFMFLRGCGRWYSSTGQNGPGGRG